MKTTSFLYGAISLAFARDRQKQVNLSAEEKNQNAEGENQILTLGNYLRYHKF